MLAGLAYSSPSFKGSHNAFTGSLPGGLEASGRLRLLQACASQLTVPFPDLLFLAHFRPRQATEICNFGTPSPLAFFSRIFSSRLLFAITSISGPNKVEISNFPQFIVKNDPGKPPHQVWGFFTFPCFLFFLIFAFSCLIFSSFPLLLGFLKPKSGPSNEVIGLTFCF